MSTLRITGSNGIATSAVLTGERVTAECVRAQLAAQGVDASVVRPKLYPRSKPVAEHFALARRRRRLNHCGLGAMLDDAPTARRHHDPGCRWSTGKGGAARGWVCAPACSIPELDAGDVDW